MKRIRITCLGEGMVEERIGPGGAIERRYGGDTLNTAIHLARLGCDVAYATGAGCDAESAAFIAALRREGLDTGLIARHPSRTLGRYRIAVDDHGERSFSYDRNESAAREMFAIARFSQALTDAAQGRAECLLFSLISLAILPAHGRQSLIELARSVRGRGGVVAYDGNYRPGLWESPDSAREWHARAIGVCDYGLPTREDEAALDGTDDDLSATEIAARWGSLGCGEVVVKAGAAGCMLPDGTMLPPSERLSPVDTSGAGDAFNAGYVVTRLHGGAPHEAASRGHRLAGWTIMRAGAIPVRDAAAPYEVLPEVTEREGSQNEQ